jgi:hypothetical protein
MFAEHLKEELLWLVEEEQDPWEDASCRDNGSGGLTALFFSEEIPDIAQAKSICRTCPLQDACLQGALERREPSGVWGGQLFVNGHILALKRRRGRPPKNPMPGVMLSA